MQRPKPDTTIPVINTNIIYKGTPCGYLFASEDVPSSAAYPISVVFSCPKCKSNHTFRADSSRIAQTPSQKKAFATYCEKMRITQTGVIIYT